MSLCVHSCRSLTNHPTRTYPDHCRLDFTCSQPHPFSAPIVSGASQAYPDHCRLDFTCSQLHPFSAPSVSGASQALVSSPSFCCSACTGLLIMFASSVLIPCSVPQANSVQVFCFHNLQSCTSLTHHPTHCVCAARSSATWTTSSTVSPCRCASRRHRCLSASQLALQRVTLVTHLDQADPKRLICMAHTIWIHWTHGHHNRIPDN